MSGDNTPFRITTWPERLPYPQRLARRPIRLQDTWFVCDDLLHVEWEEIATPGELYLELRALDLSDDSAIAGFVDRYSVLGFPNQLLELPPSVYQITIERWAEQLRGFADIESRWRRYRTSGPERPHLPGLETLDDFRFGAGLIRDLSRLWESINPPSMHTGGWDVFEDRAVSASLEQRAVLLSDMLEPGLYPFRPRVLLEEESPARGGHGSLFSHCCLELFNHISEGAAYRRCQHCGRLFVRQVGRSEHGQHRTSGDLFYHSVHCARAAAQRRYRQRRKATREES